MTELSKILISIYSETSGHIAIRVDYKLNNKSQTKFSLSADFGKWTSGKVKSVKWIWSEIWSGSESAIKWCTKGLMTVKGYDTRYIKWTLSL